MLRSPDENYLFLNRTHIYLSLRRHYPAILGLLQSKHFTSSELFVHHGKNTCNTEDRLPFLNELLAYREYLMAFVCVDFAQILDGLGDFMGLLSAGGR